jgi:DNA-binding SARP family transcriptional activator/DNA polymerase III delta prime subunit
LVTVAGEHWLGQRPVGDRQAAPSGRRCRYRVLGALRIVTDDDQVTLPSSKPSLLLGALLLHANETVSRDYLEHALWADNPPASAQAAIHAAILRLRKLLAKYADEGTAMIETVAGGYRIAADADTLDLLAFRETIGLAAMETDPAAELEQLRTALALWQGPPLANLNSPVLRRAAAAVIDARIDALARCHDIELARGHYGALVPALRVLTREYPGNERLVGQLMQALYRTGRQSEALAEWERITRHLGEQYGVDPGAALRELHLAIVRGEPMTREIEALPLPRPATPTPALPADLADFAGRDAERAALAPVLEQGSAILVLSGLPGVGKTALAVHLAHELADRFPGGRCVVTPGGTPPQLGPGRSLLVIDGAASSAEVLPLLPSDPDCTVVVTSRGSLVDLAVARGATIHRLGPLARAESLAFLRGALGDERIAEDLAAADALAAVYGDHPLALRLAVTRLALRPQQTLRGALSEGRDPLSALVVGDTALARSLHDYLAELPADASAAMAALARAGHTELTVAEAADLLSATEADTIALLDRLIEASALDYDPGGRFRLPGVLCALLRAPDSTHATDNTGDTGNNPGNTDNTGNTERDGRTS